MITGDVFFREMGCAARDLAKRRVAKAEVECRGCSVELALTIIHSIVQGDRPTCLLYEFERAGLTNAEKFGIAKQLFDFPPDVQPEHLKKILDKIDIERSAKTKHSLIRVRHADRVVLAIQVERMICRLRSLVHHDRDGHIIHLRLSNAPEAR
jgi:hypothetical protein